MMMGMMKRARTTNRAPVLIAIAAVLAVAAPSNAASQSADRSAVEQAALDYLDGFYEGSTEKLRRSVHPDVTKTGFSRQNGSYEQTPMSFEEMLSFATQVRDSGRFPPASAPKSVELLDVLDQTAVAKVHAWWGSDYLTMAKYDGTWMIVQVLWQSPPPG